MIVVVRATIVRKRKKRVTPMYQRAAMIRPIHSRASTPWRHILTFGTAAAFIVSVNVTKALLVDKLLPLFEAERMNVNFGGPFKVAGSTRGRKPLLQSIDLLGLALWYLKSRCVTYKLIPIFGVVSSTLHVWLDYSLEVLTRVVRSPANRDFEVKWQSEEEMRASATLLQNNSQNGPRLRSTVAVLNGGRMPCPGYTDANLQNAFWE